jgi:hypothetical protein
MRSRLLMGSLVVLEASVAAQHGPTPPPLPPDPVVRSVAAESGVRLALVQPPDAPVVVERVTHRADRLAGHLEVRNRGPRTVTTVVVAFTFGSDPQRPALAFRHVEPVALTLEAGGTASIDMPGIPVSLVRSLVATEAPAVELGIVGVRFTSGPAWRAAGRGSWLGRPDLAAPLVCVDDSGQTQAVDAATALSAGSAVCQGGGQ